MPRNSNWIDVSVPIYSGMVGWPGSPPVDLKRFKDMARGDSSTATKLSMSVHTGTHLDAPRHFFPSGFGIDRVSADATIGPVRVIEIQDRFSIQAEALRPHRIRSRERILFKTRNSSRCWKKNSFVEDFVYLSTEAAQFLAKRNVQTIGVDYLSIGGYRNNNRAQVHRVLLKAGICIIEGLDLSPARAGRYQMVCLPLRLVGADGAPARALLRRVGR